MKRRLWLLLSICAILVLALVLLYRPVRQGFWPEKVLSSRNNGEAQVTETSAASILGSLTRVQRTYELGRGTVVFGRMLAGSRASSYHMVRTDKLTCDAGTVWYYDADSAGWKSAPLGQMQLGTTCVYIDGDTMDYFIYLPTGYSQLENCSLCASGSSGYLSITPSGSGWKVQVSGASLAPGEVCDYTIVIAADDPSLIDTGDEAVMRLWATYCNAGDGRWCYDGYYFPAASNYIPTGANVRFRCVAAYGVSSMESQSGSSRCADLLSSAMLDTMLLQQNAAGYFPSMSGSEWLRDDYGIEPGYYDTRFNTDLLVILAQHFRRTGAFPEQISQYFNFFEQHAASCHDETENGGWLVWDYSPSQTPVHCSLNHQLAEITLLYDYADLIDRPALSTLADRMLLAIQDTCEDWIMADNNLHYCHMPDGTYGKDDYPYLTYNDLYTLQKKLETLGRGRNPQLDKLMEAKLSWMQAQGVTGYKE